LFRRDLAIGGDCACALRVQRLRCAVDQSRSEALAEIIGHASGVRVSTISPLSMLLRWTGHERECLDAAVSAGLALVRVLSAVMETERPRRRPPDVQRASPLIGGSA
jgi:hypothetical protein